MKSKIRQKFIELFRKEILSMREKRGSKFLFIPINSLRNLIRVYINEVTSNFNIADNLLLTYVVQDLVDKQILIKKPITKTHYKLNNFIYHDVRFTTFDNENYSRGTSTDEMEAYAKALGEVFERFTLKHYKDFEIKKFKLAGNDLPANVLPFNEYPQATQKQISKFNMFQIGPEDEFKCIRVEDVKTGLKKWVSVQAFTLNREILDENKIIIFSTTNGAGAGYSSGQAKSSALLELMHRHFFLNNWYRKIAPEQILFETDFKNGNSQLAKKLKDFESRGFKVHFCNYTDEAQFPTIICILKKLDGWYCGGASKPTIYTACERALDEAMSIYTWASIQNQSGVKIYDKKLLDNMPAGFLEPAVTSGVKINSFANSFFTNNFDPFFFQGKQKIIADINLRKEYTSSNLEELFPGPVFKCQYDTNLLSEYGIFIFKYYSPHTQFFSLEEVYTKLLINNEYENIFDQINFFP